MCFCVASNEKPKETFIFLKKTHTKNEEKMDAIGLIETDVHDDLMFVWQVRRTASEEEGGGDGAHDG